MPPTTSPDPWPLPEMQRARRAIVVVDVVESVRLMQEDESGFIDRWRHFVNQVRTEVLPAHGGRMVKSLGDGMLLAFEHAQQAVAAAFALREYGSLVAALGESQSRVQLRLGVHEAAVVEDDLDIYGSGVNLAARLASLGQPGDIIVSAEVRDCLISGWDADVYDLGNCYLKHVDLPVRAFRLARSITTMATGMPNEAPLLPTLAIVPFSTVGADSESVALGQVIADDLVCAMARVQAWRVLSPLTTSALIGRNLSLTHVRQLTRADYVVSGSVLANGNGARLNIHLTEATSGEVIWSRSAASSMADLLVAQDRLATVLCAEVAAALLDCELREARTAALPNLRGYTLLLHAVTLMHRCSSRDSESSQATLAHLIERHPRAADARAWMAKWHFMRLPLLQSNDRPADVAHARNEIARALEINPAHGLACALDGHLQAYFDGEPERALDRIDATLAHNPSESLAWLFKANALTALDRGDEAVAAVTRARELSPLDPIAYFFDTFAAAAYRVAGNHAAALEFAQRSVRENSLHLPGLVELILAQVAADVMDAARASAQRYLGIRPAASVQRFVDLHPARGRPRAEQEADALRAAGLPT